MVYLERRTVFKRVSFESNADTAVLNAIWSERFDYFFPSFPSLTILISVAEYSNFYCNPNIDVSSQGGVFTYADVFDCVN